MADKQDNTKEDGSVSSGCPPIVLGLVFGLGLLGEYIGRIYQQIRKRPRYIVQTIIEKK